MTNSKKLLQEWRVGYLRAKLFGWFRVPSWGNAADRDCDAARRSLAVSLPATYFGQLPP